jgi:hypothetical protein
MGIKKEPPENSERLPKKKKRRITTPALFGTAKSRSFDPERRGQPRLVFVFIIIR